MRARIVENVNVFMAISKKFGIINRTLPTPKIASHPTQLWIRNELTTNLIFVKYLEAILLLLIAPTFFQFPPEFLRSSLENTMVFLVNLILYSFFGFGVKI